MVDFNTKMDHNRAELTLISVANGWMLQHTSMAQPIDLETGRPYPNNMPPQIAVARTPEELTGMVREWALRRTFPSQISAPCLPAPPSELAMSAPGNVGTAARGHSADFD